MHGAAAFGTPLHRRAPGSRETADETGL